MSANLHKLVTDDGKELKVGDKVKTFRGETVTLTGWYWKPPPSSGRVQTDQGDFYPSVINARIIRVEESNV